MPVDEILGFKRDDDRQAYIRKLKEALKRFKVNHNRGSFARTQEKSDTLTNQIMLSKSLGDLYDRHFHLPTLVLKQLQRQARTGTIIKNLKEEKTRKDESFRSMLLDLLESIDPTVEKT